MSGSRTDDRTCTCYESITGGIPWCPIHSNYAGKQPVPFPPPEDFYESAIALRHDDPTIEQMIEEIEVIAICRTTVTGMKQWKAMADHYRAVGDTPLAAIRALYEKWKAAQ